MEILSYIVNNKKINIQIKRKNNKNMYMKIKNNDLIIVTTPMFLNKKNIINFIEKNIKKMYQYINNKQKKKLIDLEQKTIYIQGKNINLLRMKGFIKPKIQLYLNNLIVQTHNDNHEIVMEIIKKYLIKITKEYIVQQQKKYESLINIPTHNIDVSKKETSWATNYINQKKIIYSYKLGHYPKKVIDYVILHELLHYKHHNHSTNFWNEIELYMPNYKKRQQILKNNIIMKKQ